MAQRIVSSDHSVYWGTFEGRSNYGGYDWSIVGVSERFVYLFLITEGFSVVSLLNFQEGVELLLCCFVVRYVFQCPYVNCFYKCWNVRIEGRIVCNPAFFRHFLLVALWSDDIMGFWFWKEFCILHFVSFRSDSVLIFVVFLMLDFLSFLGFNLGDHKIWQGLRCPKEFRIERGRRWYDFFLRNSFKSVVVFFRVWNWLANRGWYISTDRGKKDAWLRSCWIFRCVKRLLLWRASQRF